METGDGLSDWLCLALLTWGVGVWAFGRMRVWTVNVWACGREEWTEDEKTRGRGDCYSRLCSRWWMWWQCNGASDGLSCEGALPCGAEEKRH